MPDHQDMLAGNRQEDDLEQDGTSMKPESTHITPPATQRQVKILLKALLRLGQTPEVRQEKVRTLSRALRTNGYRIDCRKLADSLITSLLFGLLR